MLFIYIFVKQQFDSVNTPLWSLRLSQNHN